MELYYYGVGKGAVMPCTVGGCIGLLEKTYFSKNLFAIALTSYITDLRVTIIQSFNFHIYQYQLL